MKSPAFQFYPSDFLSDENVVMMSNQEIGCYIKLMCFCWREGSIPSDITRISKLCGEDSSDMAKLWLAISSCFTVAIDDSSRMVHPRLEKERIKQQEHKKERSESGIKGAEARWGKHLKGNSSAIAKPIAEPMANDSSSSSTTSSTAVPLARTDKKPSVQAIEFDITKGEFSNINGQIDIWRKAYPAVIIELEINRAAAWLVANPKNHKSNYSRFLSSWFSRCQDKAPAQPRQIPSGEFDIDLFMKNQAGVV